MYLVLLHSVHYPDLSTANASPPPPRFPPQLPSQQHLVDEQQRREQLLQEREELLQLREEFVQFREDFLHEREERSFPWQAAAAAVVAATAEMLSLIHI